MARQVNKEMRSRFNVSPQDLLPATSLGWHKQGSFRGLLGKMLEMGKMQNSKTLKTTLGLLAPFSCEEGANRPTVEFDDLHFFR